MPAFTKIFQEAPGLSEDRPVLISLRSPMEMTVFETHFEQWGRLRVGVTRLDWQHAEKTAGSTAQRPNSCC